jgi:hypothetical protein
LQQINPTNPLEKYLVLINISNESKTVAVHAKINPSDAKDLIRNVRCS